MFSFLTEAYVDFFNFTARSLVLRKLRTIFCVSSMECGKVAKKDFPVYFDRTKTKFVSPQLLEFPSFVCV